MRHPKSHFRFIVLLVPLLIMIPLTVKAATGLYSSMTTLTAPVPTSGDEYSNGGSCDGNVALSDNGSIAVVGDPFASVGSLSRAGQVYFYRYLNNQWKEVQAIPDPGNTSYDNFGICIVLSADGTNALIGSDASVNGQLRAGKAYLYTLSGGIWSESHEFDDPLAISGDSFGSGGGLGISANGETLLISAVGTSVNGVTDAGVVYLESLINGQWVQATLADPDDTAYDDFGDALALTPDGSTALIGSKAPVNGQSDAGKAYLYSISGGQASETHEFDDPLAANGDHFGYADDSLSANGETALIGAWGTDVNGADGAGQAYIFHDTNGVWKETQALPDPNGLAGDSFGFPTALSDNGEIALVGSDATVNGISGTGQLYRFDLTGGHWSLVDTLTPTNPNQSNFSYNGFAMSGAGDTVLVSDPNATVNGLSNAGAAYLYQSTVNLGIGITTSQNLISSVDAEALELSVMNLDPLASAGDVTVTDTIPTGLRFIGANPDGGQCSASGGTVTCTLPTLLPVAADTIWYPTLWVQATQNSGSVIDQASVSSNEKDPNPANNQASATISLIPPPAPSGAGGGSGSFGAVALLVLMGFFGVRQKRARTSVA